MDDSLPPRRDRPASPSLRRSYSPHPRFPRAEFASERRQTSPNELLARRVLTVDAYRQELRDPRRRLGRDMEIPVPLWPGESLGQFEREFGRWLDERRVSVAALRGDPMEERDHRLQFAQARVPREAIRREDAMQESRFATAPPSPTPRSQLWSRSPPRVLIRRSRSRSPPPRDLIRRSRSPPRAMFRRARSRSPPRASSRRSRSRSPPRETRRHAAAEAKQFVRRPAQVDAEHHDHNHSRERSHSQDDRQTPYPRLPVEGPLRVDRDGRRYVADSPRWNPVARSPSPSPRSGRGVSPRHERLPSPPRGRSPSPPSSSMLPSRGRSPSSLSSSVSSPRGRRSSPSRRSALSHPRNDAIFRKNMLARRVLTVEDYRKEASELSKGAIIENDLKRPGEPMVRIPVLLKPGEWMKLYKDKLEVWLNTRRLSLASMSSNPAEERRYWLAYARSRAWPASEPLLPNENDAAARVPLHSRSRSPLRNQRRSSEKEHGRKESSFAPHKRESTKTPRDASLNSQTSVKAELPPRSDRSSSPSSSALATESPHLFRGKTRGQILLRRELSVEAFEKEVEKRRRNPEGKKGECSDDILPAIPVPLLSGETMRFYDHKFWVWLARRNMTKESLRSDAVKERQLRMMFAYMRVPESPACRTGGTDEKRATPTGQGTPEKAKMALGALRAQRPRLPLSLKRNLSEDGQQRDSPRANETKRPVVEVKLEQSRTHVIPELPLSLPPPTSKKLMRSLSSMEALERLSSSLKPPPAPAPSLRMIAPKYVHQDSGATARRPSAPSSPMIDQESATQGIDVTATATPAVAAISSGVPLVAPTTPVVPIAASISDAVTNTTEFSAVMVLTADAKAVVDTKCHDGDLLNPDGCCCPACMRSWALMLASRMDQLEGDVMRLRQDINSGGSVHAAALTSHQS